METHFSKHMINQKVPLFQNFATYAASLPVRMDGASNLFLQLYKYDYVVREADLDLMIKHIIKTKPKGLRDFVCYTSSPTFSGKTASILPAFLKSIEMKKDSGSHYIYLLAIILIQAVMMKLQVMKVQHLLYNESKLFSNTQIITTTKKYVVELCLNPPSVLESCKNNDQ